MSHHPIHWINESKRLEEDISAHMSETRKFVVLYFLLVLFVQLFYFVESLLQFQYITILGVARYLLFITSGFILIFLLLLHLFRRERRIDQNRHDPLSDPHCLPFYK